MATNNQSFLVENYFRFVFLRKKSKGLGLSLLLIFFFTGLSAQEAYNLKECIEIGLARNYNLQIARNEQIIAENNSSIGNAGYLPTLDLSAGYSGTLNNIDQTMADGSGIISSNNIHNQLLDVGLQLGWTIFDGFQIQANYSRLKELKEMGELETRISVENFIASLASEYYNYVRQNIRLKNLKTTVALSKERLRIVEARYAIGSMSRLDLQQARVDFNADSSQLLKQHELLFNSRIKLNELMALENVTKNTLVEDSTIFFDPTLNEKDIWDKTLQTNANILLLEKNKQLSRLDAKMIYSRNYPYLKLNAGYGYAQNRYEIGTYSKQQTLGFNYGLTLGFNIFDGMNRRREQRNAKIQIENSELAYNQLELTLKSDFSNIWMSYQNNTQLVDLERENQTVAKENYEIAIERYKLGDLSGIELREAQNSLISAEERLLIAEYNTKLCEISLMQISGQVTSYLNLQ